MHSGGMFEDDCVRYMALGAWCMAHGAWRMAHVERNNTLSGLSSTKHSTKNDMSASGGRIGGWLGGQLGAARCTREEKGWKGYIYGDGECGRGCMTNVSQ